MGKMRMHARDSSFLKMDAAGFVGMLLSVYETMQHHLLKPIILITHWCVPYVSKIIIFYANFLALTIGWEIIVVATLAYIIIKLFVYEQKLSFGNSYTYWFIWFKFSNTLH